MHPRCRSDVLEPAYIICRIPRRTQFLPTRRPPSRPAFLITTKPEQQVCLGMARQRVVLVEHRCLIELHDRILVLAEIGEAEAVTENCLRIALDDFLGTIEFGLRVLEFLLLAKGQSPIQQGIFPILGPLLLPQLVRLAVLLDRVVKALLRRAHPARIEVAQRVVRIEVDSLPVLLGGLFVVLLCAQGVRPAAQSELTVLGPLFLPQRVRLAVLLDRFVKALLSGAHRARRYVAPRVMRIDADGLLALLGGLFVVLLLAQGFRPAPQSALTGLRLVFLPQRIRLAV